MSLRLKIAIGMVALAIAAFAVLGDDFFHGVLGLPPNSGRIVVGGVLLVVGILWFFATSLWMRPKDPNAARTRHK
jgi:hypothetical protein